MIRDDEYTYELIDNISDARICAQMIAEEFVLHNPITIFDQVSVEDFFNERSWPIMMDIFDEQLSFLARHRDLLEDMANQFIYHRFNQTLEPCLVLHIGVGATRVEHSLKGVASRLRR